MCIIKGIGVVINSNLDLIYNYNIEGLEKELQKLLLNVNAKFEAYTTDKKVLLLEPYTEICIDDVFSQLNLDEHIGNIDEIWLTDNEWVATNDFKLVYKLLYSKE